MLPVTASRPGAKPTRPRPRAGSGRDRWLVLLVVAALVAVVLARSCRGEEATSAGHCVIPVDRSKSVIEAPELDADYRTKVRDELVRCSEDDMDAVVVAVTQNTQQDFIDPVEVESLIPAGSDDNRAAEREAKVDDAMEKVDELLDARTPSTGASTDLLTVAAVALRTFDLGDERNRLIILSDAVNTREPAQLETVPLGEDETPALVDELDDAKLVPDLTGVEVEMWGTGRGTGVEELPIERPPLIEEFWEQYWAATGARLTDYR